MATLPCNDCSKNNGDCGYRGAMGMNDDFTYSCPHWRPFMESDSDVIQGVGDERESNIDDNERDVC